MSGKDDRSVAHTDVEHLPDEGLVGGLIHSLTGVRSVEDYKATVILDDGTEGEGYANSQSEAVAQAIKDARS